MPPKKTTTTSGRILIENHHGNDERPWETDEIKSEIGNFNWLRNAAELENSVQLQDWRFNSPNSLKNKVRIKFGHFAFLHHWLDLPFPNQFGESCLGLVCKAIKGAEKIFNFTTESKGYEIALTLLPNGSWTGYRGDIISGKVDIWMFSPDNTGTSFTPFPIPFAFFQ